MIGDELRPPGRRLITHFHQTQEEEMPLADCLRHATWCREHLTDSPPILGRLRSGGNRGKAQATVLVMAKSVRIDGSAFSIADTPELQAKFGHPEGEAEGCGFPVTKILPLLHAGTGLLIEFATAPYRTQEMSQLRVIHPTPKSGDALVIDRLSYMHYYKTILIHM